MPRKKLDPFDTRIPNPLINVDEKTVSDLAYYIMDEQGVTREEALAQATQIIEEIDEASLSEFSAGERLALVCASLNTAHKYAQTLSDIPVRDLDVNPLKQERTPMSEAREDKNRSKRKKKKDDKIEENAYSDDFNFLSPTKEYSATPMTI